MRLKILFCLLLAVITTAIYLPAGHFGIIYFDDPQFVIENPEINSGLTWHSLKWVFSSVLVANWHPITSLSFVLTHQFFGQNPAAEHWVNILFHAANSALLFLALDAMTRSPWRSAVVAALFAWHPLRVESVAWISERKDVLCGFFFLLTLLAYAQYVSVAISTQDSSRFRKRFYWLTFVCFALALMSKPMAVSTPLLMLLLDIWPFQRLGRMPVRHLLIEKIPFFILAAVFCLLTFQIQESHAAVVSFDRLGAGQRLDHVILNYAGYLKKFFWPIDLAAIYPYEKITDQMEVWIAGTGLVGFSLFCIWSRSRWPALFVGWIWFIVASIPIIGLVQVGRAAMADHYTYIPLIGPAITLVWLVSDTISEHRPPKPLIVPVILGLLSIAAILTRHQVELWRDTVTLFQHSAAVTTANAATHFTLGVGYQNIGQTNAAIEHYRLATRLNRADPQPHRALAELLSATDQLDDAIAECRAALQINSNDWVARTDLAEILMRTGKNADAIAQLEAALQIDDNSPEALNNLAWLLATDSHPQARNGLRAMQLAQRACELTHFKKTIYIGTLAASQAEAGRFDDAVATAQIAIDLANQNGDRELARRNHELQDSYRRHEAYHEP